jgi:hypothetical protein
MMRRKKIPIGIFQPEGRRLNTPLIQMMRHVILPDPDREGDMKLAKMEQLIRAFLHTFQWITPVVH